ncbi:MAG TPA: hypothetical protein VMR34_02240 [Candidatus Saccharimonadales bacterium]|nr:hypothetical protein [Candidatus Saccharimonadales bacterium]
MIGVESELLTDSMLPEVSFDTQLGREVTYIDFDYEAYVSYLSRNGLDSEEIAKTRVHFNSGVDRRSKEPGSEMREQLLSQGASKKDIKRFAASFTWPDLKPRLSPMTGGDYRPEMQQIAIRVRKTANDSLTHETQHRIDHVTGNFEGALDNDGFPGNMIKPIGVAATATIVDIGDKLLLPNVYVQWGAKAIGFTACAIALNFLRRYRNNPVEKRAFGATRVNREQFVTYEPKPTR